MSNTLIDSLQFNVSSKRAALPGLDNALKKLQALDAAMGAINRRMSGLTTHSAFKRTRREIENVFGNLSKKQPSIQEMSKALGLPTKDVFQHALRQREVFENEIDRLERKRKSKELRGTKNEAARKEIGKQIKEQQEKLAAYNSTFKGSLIAGSPATIRLSGAKSASAFFTGFQQEALKSNQALVSKVNDFWSASSRNVVSGPQVVISAPPKQTAAQQVAQAAAAQAGASGGGGGGGSSSSGGKVMTKFKEDVAAVKRKLAEDIKAITEVAEKPTQNSKVEAKRLMVQQVAAHRQRAAADIVALTQNNPDLKQESTTVQKALEDAAKLERKANISNARQRADQVTAIHRTEQQIEDAKAANKTDELKALRKQLAAQKKQLTQAKKQADVASLRQDALADSQRHSPYNANYGDAKGEYDARHGAVSARAALRNKKLIQDIRLGRKTLPGSILKGGHAKDIEAELASLGLLRTVPYNPPPLAPTRAPKHDEAMQAALAMEDYVENERRTTHASARRQLDAARAKAGSKYEKRGDKETVTYEEGGRRFGVTADFSKKKATVTDFNRELKATREELGLLGGDFVKNTAKVAAWSASVGLLYQGLGLVAHAYGRVVEVGAQSARLDQVFRGIGGTTRDLTDDVLRLAAANGRSTDEAMQSAVQWSRLGLSRAQVNEAVRVSLVAANVAELSAAESTTKLQAIMQNYGLRVSDLSTVLGQLNQISNTYNVTNGDMLEGLSRSAAVAKQAGLPLQELQGIIGATVGATGQTGANIGNAIKSVITAMGNPALQKKLRDNYGIETRDSAGGLQDMSTALANTYVHYQRLDEAKQRSLVFDMAGKTQSTRLAAVLDNYVKAQMLAIDSQLNLNSAEKENAKIKETLRSRTAALAAEFERFAVAQSGNGIKLPMNTDVSAVGAMKEMMSAMRGLLQIANNPKVSWLLTALTGLAVAGGARALMAGLSTGGTGFLGRSGAALSGIGKSTNQLTQDVMQVYGQRKVDHYKLRATPNSPPYARPMPMDAAGNMIQFTKFESVINKWQTMMARATGSTSAFVRGLGMIGNVAGAGAVAMVEFAVPIAIVTSLMWGFNRVMEYVGQSSEDAEKTLAGFSEQAQEAAASANAYRQAASLFQTVQKAFTPEAGFQALRADRGRKMLAQASPAFGLYEPDKDKRETLNRRLTEQAESLRSQGDNAGLINLLEEERNKLLSGSLTKLREQSEISFRESKRRREEIDRLDKSILPNHKKLKELKKQEAESQEQMVVLIQEQENALAENIAHDQRHLVALEKQKGLLTDIADIFASISTSNPIEKHFVKVAALDAQTYANNLRLGELETAGADDNSAVHKRDDKLKRLKEQAALFNEVIANAYATEERIYTRKSDSLFGGEVLMTTPTVKKYAPLLEKNLAEQEALQKDGALTKADAQWAMNQAEQKALRERNAEIEQERARESEARARRLSDMQAGTRAAHQFGAGVGVGASRTEQLVDERKQLGKELATSLEDQTLKGRAKSLELINMLQENGNQLLMRSQGIHKDINQLVIDRAKEFNRSIMGSGPADLLRKLAAMKMAAGGKMDANAMLFGMNPDMRQDYAGALATQGKSSPLDPELRALLKERAAAGRATPDVGMGSEILTEWHGKLTQQLSKEIPDAFALGVTLLSQSVDKITAQLDRVSGALAQVQVGTGTDRLYGNKPVVPQSTGVGGADGRIVERG